MEYPDVTDTYNTDLVVEVRPFTKQVEGDEVIIGNPELGTFLVFPQEAIELLEGLAEGKSVSEVSALFEQNHGEKPDMEDFLSFLQQKGIVWLPGGEQNETRRLQLRNRYGGTTWKPFRGI